MTDTAIVRPRKKSPPPTANGSAAAHDIAAETRSLMLLEAVLALRDGDFSIRLPAGWAGTDGRIADAFNQALTHLDGITREVTRVSVVVGKEGRLKQRLAVPGATGGWATNVNALNTLLDDLVRPTTDVAR